jgi:hypothetical protein
MMEKLFIAILVIFILISIVGAYAQYHDCSEKNGVLVKGMFHYECINTRN